MQIQIDREQSTAPIALFCYNRLDCLKQTVTALQANELASDSDLFIFSDGPKPQANPAAVNEVRKYLKTITGFHSIHIKEAETNQGLANSIISGVTEIVNRFGRIIVLEDDLVTSRCFLRFMNEALDFYENNEKVAGIHGFCPFEKEEEIPETYFMREVGCWGWATWKRGWELFEADTDKLLSLINTKRLRYEFNVYDSYPYYEMLLAQKAGQVDSWAIRWYASVFLKGKLGLQPGRNLVSHIGYQQGTHCKGMGLTPEGISDWCPEIKEIPVKNAEDIRRNPYARYYRSIQSKKQNKLKKIVMEYLPYRIVVFLMKLKRCRR